MGTITEIYDYLRLLYARVGTPHCSFCNKEISSQNPQSITKSLLNEYNVQLVKIMAPIVRARKGEYEKLFIQLNKQGYINIRVDGKVALATDYFGLKSKKLNKQVKHNIEAIIDILKLEQDNKSRLQRAVEQSLDLAAGLVLATIEPKNTKLAAGKKIKNIEKIFSKHLACLNCDYSLEKLQPRMFSFNSPFGACPVCQGLGFVQKFEQDLIIPDKDVSLRQGAIQPQGFSTQGFFGQMLERLAEEYDFSLDNSVRKLADPVIKIIFYGSDKKLDWRFSSCTSDSYWEWNGRWEGIIPRMERLYKQTSSDYRCKEMEKFMINKTCTACGGMRLKPESLAVTIGKKILVS